jgi:hypothetical protein
MILFTQSFLYTDSHLSFSDAFKVTCSKMKGNVLKIDFVMLYNSHPSFFVKVTVPPLLSGFQIRIRVDPLCFLKIDPDPHYSEELDPDPVPH